MILSDGNGWKWIFKNRNYGEENAYLSVLYTEYKAMLSIFNYENNIIWGKKKLKYIKSTSSCIS